MNVPLKEAHALPRNVLILDNELGMGGLEKKLYDFVVRVDRTRFNIAVCCLKEGGYFKRPFEELGIHFHEQLLAHKFDALAYRKLHDILQGERIDLIYTFAHTNTMFFAYLAKLTRQVQGVIISTHATGTESGGRMFPFHKKRLLGQVDAVISVAHQHKRYLVEREGLAADKIHVIQNGVDVDKYRPGEPAEGVSTAMGLKKGERVVTAVASLKPLKCLDNLLAAAHAIGRDDVRYVLVGDGPSRRELEQLTAKLNIADRVTFMGIRQDVEEILRASDIVVLPSRTEAFPNVVLEAMATGLPVVTTDVGSVREIVVDGESGWIVPREDVGSLTEKLRDLLEDPAKARHWGERGRQIVEADFRIEGMCEKREALFAQVLGNTTHR